mmetsp:Transcript_1653/g.3653  ORF Transcript_1653/g.3653 Transcript_1653/m.3653 type:complete len:101 (-) Transcript_1653:3024-3326(-)
MPGRGGAELAAMWHPQLVHSDDGLLTAMPPLRPGAFLGDAAVGLRSWQRGSTRGSPKQRRRTEEDVGGIGTGRDARMLPILLVVMVTQPRAMPNTGAKKF